MLNIFADLAGLNVRGVDGSRSNPRGLFARCLAGVLALTLAACSTPFAPEPTATPLPPTQTPLPTAVPTNTPVPTATPFPIKTIAIDPSVPTNIRKNLLPTLKAFVGSNPIPNTQLQLTEVMTTGFDILINTMGLCCGLSGAYKSVFITHTYAVAAPFPTTTDAISFTNLSKFWQGDAQALPGFSTLFVDETTRAEATNLMGLPGSTVQVIAASELVSATWGARPGALAILPFDQLEARWKVLQVDPGSGTPLNLFERETNILEYPLSFRVGAVGDQQIVTALANAIPPSTNRDPNKMAVVAMTGVTALVRGTAVLMEQKGITYPGQLIQGWLATADIAHISNEVSFWGNCPAPTFNDGVSMCSSPKYIDLLKFVGTDVIELTGNHLWDKSPWFLTSTIQTYKDLGWGYFGGGLDITDSLKPLTMAVNGNKIAFVGCNWFGADWATETYPGSAPCGADNPHALDLITPTIKALKEEGYLVIGTLQYLELYDYVASYQQALDFAALRDAGAVVVNGSQGHHVQGFDVSAQGFIHYGTGNLFFGDQEGIGTHQTFVDRHVFYDGKYLGTDLRTAFIIDYSQPKPMTPEDRAALLKILFKASGY